MEMGIFNTAFETGNCVQRNKSVNAIRLEKDAFLPEFIARGVQGYTLDHST